MDIPEEILESAFVMNPETEDVIFSGDLREGMIVFSEDPMTRNFIHLTAHSTYRDLDENYRQLARKRNRWMKVTHLWEHREDKAYRFVGEFSDGLKCTVYAPYSMGWYVKKESIEETESFENLDIKYNVVNYQGRQCTRCKYGHIYNEVCSTTGCIETKDLIEIATAKSFEEAAHKAGYPTQPAREMMRDSVRRGIELRNELTIIVGTAMEDADIHSDDLIMWTTKRNRAVNLILKQMQDREARLHRAYRDESKPSQD